MADKDRRSQNRKDLEISSLKTQLVGERQRIAQLEAEVDLMKNEKNIIRNLLRKRGIKLRVKKV